MVPPEIKKGFSFGAGGAFIASLCCITPMAIFFFGFGTLSFALSFIKYKPFFLVAGLLFVLLAIFFRLKKKGAICSIDPNEIKRKKYFIATVVVVMILLYIFIQYAILPYLGKSVYR